MRWRLPGRELFCWICGLRNQIGGELGFEDVAEPPRHIIVSARTSPMVELTRWLFERYRLAYHERARAPVLHILATHRRGAGRDRPVVIGSDGVWTTAREILDGIDAKSRPGDRLYGETEEERESARRLIDAVLDLLPDRGDDSPRRVGEACDLIEAELARRGTRFVGGSTPNIVDIVFSALSAPMVLPAEHGTKLPLLEDLPPELQRQAAELRARRAGRLVLETYEAARPPPQPYLRRRRGSGLLSVLLLGPTLPRWGARIAAAYGRVIRIWRYALASRWVDVEEILRRDLDFRIAPINGPRIEEVNGPFVLGLDRGDRLVAERTQLYAAVSAIDLAGVRDLARAQAEWLLDRAAAAHGRIDVVNGYARLVAARNAQRIFGIAGPTEMDLMRVVRAIFNHTFLNLFGDEQVRTRALAAAAELKMWFEAELARRQKQGLEIDDVIGRLLALRVGNKNALDDDGVRRNVAGLLVGAIDTTATCVGKIVSMAVSDRRLLERMRRDLDSPERLFGWCNEVLRLWPHNPILLRRTASDVSLGGKIIPAGTTIAAFTHAALFDPGRFPDPGRLDPAARRSSTGISAVACMSAPAALSTRCRSRSWCAAFSRATSCARRARATTGRSLTRSPSPCAGVHREPCVRDRHRRGAA